MMPPLTFYQREYLESALRKLQAVLDGTLAPGDGETVSVHQVVACLRHVRENVGVALYNIEDHAASD